MIARPAAIADLSNISSIVPFSEGRRGVDSCARPAILDFDHIRRNQLKKYCQGSHIFSS
jgi:hypothetical protein